MIQATYYCYWGKAQKDSQENDDTPKYHLLPYHCLDVAAVADVWWQNSHSLRQQFMGITGLDEEQTHAWLRFFIALHDYGKFDLRFQRKAKKAWEIVNPELSAIPTQLNELAIRNYYHGPAGLYWFYQDFQERFSSGDGYYVEDNGSGGYPPRSVLIDACGVSTAELYPAIVRRTRLSRYQ